MDIESKFNVVCNQARDVLSDIRRKDWKQEKTLTSEQDFILLKALVYLNSSIELIRVVQDLRDSGEFRYLSIKFKNELDNVMKRLEEL